MVIKFSAEDCSEELLVSLEPDLAGCACRLPTCVVLPGLGRSRVETGVAGLTVGRPEGAARPPDLTAGACHSPPLRQGQPRRNTGLPWPAPWIYTSEDTALG